MIHGKRILFLLMSALTLVLFSQKSAYSKSGDGIIFTPIEHATMVIEGGKRTIYVDPVGSAKLFEGFKDPDIILITDVHYDHLNADVLKLVKKKKTVVIAPKAVIDQLEFGEIINNGEKKKFKKITIEAVPMYNLTPDRLKFHEKGRGNGYIITINKKRIYISGDTEDIPEMRELKNIDYAFVCMNLPYTMTVKQAASAVLKFKPAVVFPYHYRGKDRVSDVEKFRELVSKDKMIEVRLLEWYNK